MSAKEQLPDVIGDQCFHAECFVSDAQLAVKIIDHVLEDIDRGSRTPDEIRAQVWYLTKDLTQHLDDLGDCISRIRSARGERSAS